MLEIKNKKEMEKYFVEATNTYEFKENGKLIDVTFKCDVDYFLLEGARGIKANRIYANDIYCDLVCANYVEANNINCFDLCGINSVEAIIEVGQEIWAVNANTIKVRNCDFSRVYANSLEASGDLNGRYYEISGTIKCGGSINNVNRVNCKSLDVECGIQVLDQLHAESIIYGHFCYSGGIIVCKEIKSRTAWGRNYKFGAPELEESTRHFAREYIEINGVKY